MKVLSKSEKVTLYRNVMHEFLDEEISFKDLESAVKEISQSGQLKLNFMRRNYGQG